jgi:uncharacterized protein YraI
MEQVRRFDRSKAGRQAGWCLRNVRMGYSIAPVHPDAWTAWNNTPQKRNRTIPTGVDVPLYYDYTTGGNRYGHINVRLADGRIWNDGNYFANLAAFERAWSNVKYVGWSTHVNGVEVIKPKENNVRNPNQKDVRDYFNVWLKKAPTASQLSHYPTHDWRKLVDDVFGQYKRDRDAVENKLRKDLTDTTKAHATANKTNEKLMDLLNEKQQEVEILQDDVANLKTLKKEAKIEIKQADKEILNREKQIDKLQLKVDAAKDNLTPLGHIKYGFLQLIERITR